MLCVALDFPISRFTNIQRAMEVIAISGKKGTGKDWMARRLLDESPAYTAVIAFADPLKQRLYGQDHYDVLLDEKPIDIRALLIETGTAERMQHGPMFYAKQLIALVNLYRSRGFKRVIITDLRLKCELAVLQSREAMGDFKLRLKRMIAPKRNRLRILREAKGETERAEHLAADISETDLDELENSGMFELIHNDVDTLESENEPDEDELLE